MSISVANSLNTALNRMLAQHSEVYLLGEDILDPYGGAFKISQGLSTQYPDRVITTPISEAGLVGLAAGMAMRGLRPIVEIMFGDFTALCMDQLLNHATKYGWMYNDQVEVPLTIRTPMGGRRGYGPTHSQTLDHLFLGVPLLEIIAVSPVHDPGKLLETTALTARSPRLFLENKTLYPHRLLDPEETDPDGFISTSHGVEFPTITMLVDDGGQPDITLLAYGGMVPIVRSAALELADHEGIKAEIVIPSMIKPLDLEPILDSIERSGRLLVAEEGTLTNGWGAEVSARVMETGFELLESPVRRVAARDLPIGSSKVLEDSTLPQKENIVSMAMEVVGWPSK